MKCLYEARNMTKCPLKRDVQLREVSVRGGSTVVVYTKIEKRHIGGDKP